MTSEEVRLPYQYSIKLEVNAKGWVQPSVHIYGDNLYDACAHARMALNRLVADLHGEGFKVATDVKEVVKEKD